MNSLEIACRNFCAIAESRIGCITLWAQKGPRLFDCSGLVAWSLLKAGFRSKEHDIMENWNALRMARDLYDWRVVNGYQKGDLAFYGPSWARVQHVAIVWDLGVLSASGATKDIRGIEQAKEDSHRRVRLEPNVNYRKDYLGVCRIRPYLEKCEVPGLIITEETVVPFG